MRLSSCILGWSYTHILHASTACYKGNNEIQLIFLHSSGQNISNVSFTSRYFVHSSYKNCYNNWSSSWRGCTCYWESCCTTEKPDTSLCKVISTLTGSCLKGRCNYSTSIMWPYNTYIYSNETYSKVWIGKYLPDKFPYLEWSETRTCFITTAIQCCFRPCH